MVVKKDKKSKPTKGSGSDTSEDEAEMKKKFEIPTADIDVSKPDDSGSETSDGQGGRIRRKLKVPGFGISGGIRRDKDSDSDSETSDGDGGRIKRKFKMPSIGFGISGGVKGPKADDDSGSETSDGQGGKIKRKLKPKFGIGIGGVAGDVEGRKSDSGSDTSDGKGGRIKRKLKTPSFGFGFSADKTHGDSSSETSDGEGGRIKRKLKVPKFGIEGEKSGSLSGQFSTPVAESITQSAPDKKLDVDFDTVADVFDLSVDVPTVSENVIEVQSTPGDDLFSAPGGSLFGSTDVELKTDEGPGSIPGTISTPEPAVVLEEFAPSPVDETITQSAPDLKADVDFNTVEALFNMPSSEDKNFGISIDRESIQPGGSVSAPTQPETSARFSASADTSLRTSSTDDATLDSSVEGMAPDDIKQFIFRKQRQGYPGAATSYSGGTGASSTTIVTEKTVMVPKLETRGVASYSSSAQVQTSSTTVTRTFATRSSTKAESSSASFSITEPSLDSSVETKVKTSAEIDELETSIQTMEPGDIKKLIFSSSRTGRLSLPADKDTKPGGRRRPVSMDVSSSYSPPKPSGLSTGARSLSSENLASGKAQLPKAVTVILKDDDSTAGATGATSTKTSSSVTQQSYSTSYRSVYSKQGDTAVGFEGLKGIAAEEHKIGSTSFERSASSSTSMSSTSTSRITMTSQTHVRKVPSLSRTFPELLDEEIRQVKASSEKSDTIEDRRRWSMEKRSEWMLSSPTSDSPQASAEGGQERKKLTLRERKRLLLGHDDEEHAPKDKQ